MFCCTTIYCYYCIWCSFLLIFAGILYYKNVSFVIAKRLLRETNVVIILVFGLCNWSIDIARPAHSLSPVNGLIYMLIVSAFVFVDAVKVKSRVFVIVVGILFVLININNIYNLIFTDWDQGVVLFNYTIQGNKYTFMKRSTKRSIFIQVMLFSMNGIYTIFKDRKQELMIFATGHIYRETGTGQENETDDGNVRTTQRLSYNLKREIVKRVATRGQISITKILPCANTKDSWGRRSRQTMGWSGASSGVNAGRGCLLCLR